MRNKSEYKVNEDTSGAGEADREIIMEELSNLSFNKTIPILVALMLIKLEKYRYTMSKENINLMIKTTNSHLLKNQKDRTSNVVSRQFSHNLNILLIICIGGGKRGGLNQDNGNY